MPGVPVRVLLIQSWVVPGAVTRDALVAGGYLPHIYRVDFESALLAVLPRRQFDIVLLDTKSSGISRGALDGLMRELGIKIPVIELAPGVGLADAVREALVALQN